MEEEEELDEVALFAGYRTQASIYRLRRREAAGADDGVGKWLLD